MLAAKVESVQTDYLSAHSGQQWIWLPLQRLISLASVTVMLCNKLPQIQWLEIRSIKLTVLGSEIYSGLCCVAR